MDKPTETSSPSAATTATTSSTMPTSTKKRSNAALIVIILLLVICCCCVIPGVLLATGTLQSIYTNNLGTRISDDRINDFLNDYSNPDGANGGNNDTPAAEPAPGNPEIGATKTVGDWEVTLNSVETAGRKYVLDLSVKNTSTRSLSFSTVLFLSVESPSNSGYDRDYFYETEEILDANVESGATQSGVVVYNVDDNPETLTLKVKGQIFGDEEVSFRLK